MSIDYGNLCSVILKQCFGETVQLVGDCLFAANARTLSNIAKTTKLSRREVSTALGILIKYQLINFQANEVNAFVAEYTLKREEILYILRYSRYVHLIQTMYGSVGAAIAEELLYSGSQTASNTLLKCMANNEITEKAETIRDTFFQMIRDNYLIKLPMLVTSETGEPDAVPKLHIEDYDLFNPPDIDLPTLAKIHNGALPATQLKDTGVFWQLNFKRFHQDFRDSLMISAVERKLGASAGECFKFILKQMYERTDPWQRQYSNPFTVVEVKQQVEKNSSNLDLLRHLEKYVALIADDSLHFIRKIGEMGGGQYVVDMAPAFESLALACIENVITERFGSKASRIFRVVRMKKYIEQEELQKEAMIPAKEAKLLSYSLFQEQFLQIKTIRKAGGGGTGPAKAFYLFYLKHKQITKMLLDICFKALYNDITRSNYEKNEHKRLIEKSQKLDSIVATMKERGESEEYIAEILETLTPPEREILDKVKNRIKTLSKAELSLDDTIFLLQMYIYHSAPTYVVATNKKASSNQ
ncbi:DNA-directed RNA polymerase III subunit RPC3 [Stomoxys calcitrans]|uniref:DNA-directed RNA polymerase III subunit RPC3 n=1 Tax=Stomoxys calcitrans TaxID=35570 RepID=UPI0027E30FBA|nr:DNA-directed RNA polymerase III subunit RPC3 [Stomoxys calcitrans]